MKKKLYRMLDTPTGETTWSGYAYSPEHAEEKCFYDETPGSLERFTLQVWGKVKISRTMSQDGWKTVYENQCLSPV